MARDNEVPLVGIIDASIPGADCFFRKQPAQDELRPDALRIAQQVVDYGCFLFQVANKVRPERRVCDLVVAALLRRAVITVEGVRVLVCAGLLEPTLGLSRTLQDIELALKLVLGDDTDRHARALAAWHYLQYQSHGEGMLRNPATRRGPLTAGERVDEVRAIARNWAALLNSAVFDDVRDAVRNRAVYWHGYKSTEEAFRAIGQEPDYWMTYDSASWFVHASNIEHDMVDAVGDQVSFRAFVERDPAVTRSPLGLALLKALELYGLVVSAKNVNLDEVSGGGATVRLPGREPEHLGSLDALRALVLREFDIRPDAPFQPATPCSNVGADSGS